MKTVMSINKDLLFGLSHRNAWQGAALGEVVLCD
jgi:hypothetical protein